MRKVLGALALATLFALPASAGVWESQCMGCHNGSLAPSKAQLKAKFKNAKAFVEAAKRVNNPMMAAFKTKVNLLEQAAKELYK
ncbi:hypothetical protein [Thermovibrio sp.]